MTKNSKLESQPKPEPKAPKKKLTRAEKEDAFRLMNENWSKGMDLYLATVEKGESSKQ